MHHLLKVSGMTCGYCEKAVTRAVKEIDPQAIVVIDRNTDTVRVESEKPREQIAQAIGDEGYAVAAAGA